MGILDVCGDAHLANDKCQQEASGHKMRCHTVRLWRLAVITQETESAVGGQRRMGQEYGHSGRVAEIRVGWRWQEGFNEGRAEKHQ